jgi:uncharacterized protein YfaS (alpha-2-macroglobulin family)
MSYRAIVFIKWKMQHKSNRTELSARALISVFLVLVFTLPQSQALDLADTDSPDFPQLQFNLREKKSVRAATSATVTPLPADRTKILLDQLHQLTKSANPASSPSMQLDQSLHVIDSQKPPEAQLALQFPPAANTVSGLVPLKITSYGPSGEQPLASDISVHFNEQMIPLETIKTSQKRNIPITISPAQPGNWEWLDPYTASFKHRAARLPMATHYVLSVSTELTSLAGNHLDKDFTWTLDTPPINQMNWIYDNWCKKNNCIPVSFEQKVSAEKLLPFLHLKDVEKDYPLKVIPTSEWASLNFADQRFNKEMVVLLQPPANTPKLKKLTLQLYKGAPAEEGPLCSKESLETECEVGLPPFACEGWIKTINRKNSRTYVENIEPNRNISISFNSPLKGSVPLSDLVTVSPPIPNLRISTNNSTIILYGSTEANQTYRITLNPAIEDCYGRTLGKTQPLTINVRKHVAVNRTRIRQKASHSLINTYQPIFILSPHQALAPQISIQSINDRRLKVKIFQVTADDWHTVDNQLVLPERKPVFDKTIKVTDFKINQTCQTSVDLQPFLKDDFGQLLVDVSELPERAPVAHNDVPERHHYRNWTEPTNFKVWVEKTDLAVQSSLDQNKLVCFVTSLKTGHPCNRAAVSFEGDKEVARTNVDGLCEIQLSATNRQAEVATRTVDEKIQRGLVRVSKDADEVVLPGAIFASAGKENIIEAFTDKNLYKAGETVNVKGWMRSREDQPLADLALLNKAGAEIFYRVRFGNREIAKGQGVVGNLDSFQLPIALPEKCDLGMYTIEIRREEKSVTADGETQFQIQEFRQPQFEISVKTDNASPVYSREKISFTTAAKYFSGSPLSRSSVEWQVKATRANYSPPKWMDYTFQDNCCEQFWNQTHRKLPDWRAVTQNLKGKSNQDGQDEVEVQFTRPPGDYPVIVQAEATVKDFNSQTWSDTASVLVHPSKRYVGLKVTSGWEKDEVFKILSIVTDVDGNSIAGDTINLTAEEYPTNGNQYPPTRSFNLGTVKSQKEPVELSIKLPYKGEFQIVARVVDAEGCRNKTGINVYVPDSAPLTNVAKIVAVKTFEAPRTPEQLALEQGVLQVLPDKASYKPGDVAKLHIHAPVENVFGTVTVSHRGIVSTKPLHLHGRETDVEIPIEGAFIPNCFVHVNLSAPASSATDTVVAKRLSLLTASTTLYVAIESRTLNVSVEPQAKMLEPGAESHLDVAVKYADGSAAKNTDICAIIVDESVLALTGYSINNPINAFYRANVSDYCSLDNRAYTKEDDLKLPEEIGRIEGPRDLNLFQVEPSTIDERHYTSGRSERHQKTSPTLPEGCPIPDDDGASPAKPRLRSNFASLALFAPNVRADKSGHASIPFTIPDSLTRYRVFVIAADSENYFGKGESNIAVDKILSVRPSVPRFANIGDKFQIPVIIKNGDNKSATIELVAKGSGAINGESGYKIELPAGDRTDLTAPVFASSTGSSLFAMLAISNSRKTDLVHEKITVQRSATTEDLALNGSIDRDSVKQMLAIPSKEETLSSNLDLRMSSSAVGDLRGATTYLREYPYGCSEQLASRIMAFSALRKMPMMLRQQIADSDSWGLAQADVIALSKRQKPDGSFPLWEDDSRTNQFASICAAHALYTAQKAGYSVDAKVLQQSLAYLQSLYKNKDEKAASGKLSNFDRSLLAYAIYVENLMGQPNIAHVNKLFSDSKMQYEQLDVLAWTLPTLLAIKSSHLPELQERLRGAAHETQSTVHFTDVNQDVLNLFSNSDERLNALALDALMSTTPDDLLIPEIARGLLLSQRNGHWLNTSDNAFALLALSKYFEKYEAAEPNFVANLWVDNLHLAKQAFAGRSPEPKSVKVNLQNLQMDKSVANLNKLNEIVLNKEGDGRLYYRLGLHYALKKQDVQGLDRGIVVKRSYSATGNDEPLKVEGDTVVVKKGATIRVDLVVAAPSRRYYTALVDPLPAAFESVNSDLIGTNTNEHDNFVESPYQRMNCSHRNMRDDRTEIFVDELAPGVCHYSYFVHATTPGTFIAPPAKIEEMYNPEVFGRSDSCRIVVEDEAK